MLKNLLFKFMTVALFLAAANVAFGQGMSCDMAEVVTEGTYTLADTIPSNGNNTQASAAPGVADGAVWYSYTADETGTIDINSCLGGADTRLFVHTGTCDDPTLIAANDDACEQTAGGDAFASQVAGLTVVAGTTYLIEWDNNWDNSAFTWSLTFTPLPAADVATAAVQQNLNVPVAQNGLYGLVGNLGSEVLTGVVLTVEVFAADDLDNAIATGTSEPVLLEVGEVQVVSAGSFEAMVGDYVMTYSVTANETEEDTETDNNDDENTITYTGALYSYEDGPTNNLGVGNGAEILQGNTYFFYAADTVLSVYLDYTGGVDGESVELVIFDTDDLGTPTDELYAQEAPIAATGGVTIDLDEQFNGEAGGYYFVGIRSTTAANVGMGLAEDVFYPGQAWLQIGGGAWNNPEAFGFPGAYVVRLNTLSNIAPMLTLQVDMSNEDVGDNGVFVAGTFNGWAADATEMFDEDGDGVYTATVEVEEEDAQWKFLNGPDYAFEETVPAECGVDNGFGGFNRFATVDADITLDAVCFSECAACMIAQAPCDNPDALVCDNFDSYDVGPVSDQSDQWRPWNNAADGSAPVVTEQAQSAPNSLQVVGGGPIDQLLIYPENYTTGIIANNWSMYIPAGAGAYFNFQGDRDNEGSIFKLEAVFQPGDEGVLNAGGGDAAFFDFPTDVWFDVNTNMDLDNGLASIYINGDFVYEWDYTLDSGGDPGTAVVGAVNFFPLDATYNFFVDDIEVLPLDEFPVSPALPVSVTLTVDTKFSEVAADGMFAAGTFNGFVGQEMTDNGNDTWSITVEVPQNSEVLYKFQNGFEGWESVPEECGLDDGFGGFNRNLNVEEDDVEVDAVCFGQCVACDLTDVIDATFDAGFAVSPNPTAGIFTVAYSMDTAADLDIRISNMLGQIVATRKVDAAVNGNVNFDLTDMATGNYTVVITDGARISTKRVVVQ